MSANGQRSWGKVGRVLGGVAAAAFLVGACLEGRTSSRSSRFQSTSPTTSYRAEKSPGALKPTATAPYLPTARGFGSEALVGKKCSGCGRDVSLGASVGQRCPHCGGIWSFERKVHVNDWRR